MYFLISIPTEAFYRVMALRRFHRQLGAAISVTRDAATLLQQVRGSFGGRLVLVDWRRGEVLADKPLLGAAGLGIDGRTIVTSSWIEPYLYVMADGQEVGRVTNRWFNYIHSVELTAPQRALVACAGSDLIAEIAFDGEVVWDWFGPEHGYDTRTDGTPAFFDRHADYRAIRVGTADQAMHVTSALTMPDGTILATLFHQGVLIAIERNSGSARVVLDGLSKPHGVHTRDGGFLLSDTLGHRIVLLDDRLRVCSEISVGSQWLQDSLVTSAGTYLTLENVHIDQGPQGELCNRITEIDEAGRRLRSVEIGVDFRLFTAREIDESFAGTLARAWGRSGSCDTWRWH